MNYINHDQFTKMVESQGKTGDVETAFNLFDKDRNGQLSAAEFRHTLTEFNLHASDAQVYSNTFFLEKNFF